MKLTRRAFTLVEMLIVIVIIGILAAALLPQFRGMQGRARDTARDKALYTVATALEMYANDNAGYYPKNDASNAQYTSTEGLKTVLESYMENIPDDSDVALASDNGTCIDGTNGSYAYYPTGGPDKGAKGYAITVALESDTGGNTITCDGQMLETITATQRSSLFGGSKSLKTRTANIDQN